MKEAKKEAKKPKVKLSPSQALLASLGTNQGAVVNAPTAPKKAKRSSEKAAGKVTKKDPAGLSEGKNHAEVPPSSESATGADAESLISVTYYDEQEKALRALVRFIEEDFGDKGIGRGVSASKVVRMGLRNVGEMFTAQPADALDLFKKNLSAPKGSGPSARNTGFFMMADDRVRARRLLRDIGDYALDQGCKERMNMSLAVRAGIMSLEKLMETAPGKKALIRLAEEDDRTSKRRE